MIRPPGNKVLILIGKEVNKLKSDLLEVINEDNTPEGVGSLYYGQVVDIGPGRWNATGKERLPMEVKAGDKVIFTHDTKHSLIIRKKEADYTVVKEKFVVAVLED